ncbi:MAG TPA: type 1 glutamine amidotransferase domain-containing protein [Tepidisphaeraceae bacterium]|jgi:protease I
MAGELKGKKVAILVENGFEQVEMTEPRKALEMAGAGVDLISPQKGRVRAFKHDDPGDWFDVDVALDEANPDDYDALELPGGVANPDRLRINPTAVHFVRRFFEQHKPVAVICHGPWTLIDADVVKGRTLTSWPSLKTDLQNAGAHWVDEQVVVDNGLVSSRKPDDIPAFNRKMIEEFREGEHARQEPAAAFAG